MKAEYKIYFKTAAMLIILGLLFRCSTSVMENKREAFNAKTEQILESYKTETNIISYIEYLQGVPDSCNTLRNRMSIVLCIFGITSPGSIELSKKVRTIRILTGSGLAS